MSSLLERDSAVRGATQAQVAAACQVGSYCSISWAGGTGGNHEGTALADALTATYSKDAVRERTDLIRREYVLWMVEVYDTPGLLEGQR